MKIQSFVLFVVILLPNICFGERITLVECGKEWINLHKGNEDLVGVYVQQYPDPITNKEDYEGKHPYRVIYVFNNNKQHVVYYTPSGQVQSGLWTNLGKNSWVYEKMSKNLNLDRECAYWFKDK